MHNWKPAVGYIKVPPVTQGGLALERQADLLRDYALNNGLELLGTYDDIGSGADNNRHGAREAIRHAIREGATLLLADANRLARRGTDTYHDLSNGLEVVVIGTGDRAQDADEVERSCTVAPRHLEAVGRSTSRSLAERKGNGMALVNTEVLEQHRHKGTKATKDRANARDERLADFLAEKPDTGKMTAGEIAALLNASGARKSRGREWTAAALRRPLRRARAILAERAEVERLLERLQRGPVLTEDGELDEAARPLDPLDDLVDLLKDLPADE